MTYMENVFDTKPSASWRFLDELSPQSTHSPRGYQAHAKDYVDEFNDLVRRWRLETAFSSAVMEKIQNPSFQQIVRLGTKVVPLIIQELRVKRDFLFMALSFLHPDEDVISEEAKGNPHEMINAWLSWAERRRVHAD